MASSTGTQGLGSDNMSQEDKDHIHSMGGSASGGNFAKDPARASKAGKKGAAAQSTEAKARGGRNSHRGSAAS
ncbi:MAG TPA: hypothetical protein VLI54_00695 [Bacillota bacterium]|nr:hypothetical protein [Bacillota bacterium]